MFVHDALDRVTADATSKCLLLITEAVVGVWAASR